MFMHEEKHDGVPISILIRRRISANSYTVVLGRLNVVKSLKQTNQIVSFGRGRHMIGLQRVPVRIYLARDHSRH
jgi:hypothetical protein